MKTFVIGATGYIGGSLAEHLRDSGHDVIGLARTEDKAAQLRQRGITPLIGDLDDAEALSRGATTTDGTVNAGDAGHMRSMEIVTAALAGSGKPLIHTSGSSIICDDAQGEYASEHIFPDDAAYTPMEHRLERIAVDNFVRIAGVTQGIRTAVVCPTTIYGDGRGMKLDSDQVPKTIVKSKERGAGVYIGKGLNIWSNVFIDDLSELYRLVLEKAPSGSFFFAENGENTLLEVATAISRSLGFGGKIESWDLEEATQELGSWPRIALATNSRVRSTNARNLLGWKPFGPSLTEALVG